MDEPRPDFAWIQCERCGLIEALSAPESFDRDSFAELVESVGWSAEHGPVWCPDCLDAVLRPGPDRETEKQP